ncbi:MAG: hypothetical protein KC777_20145 [Cyanobacteria bacterium HKST-UBA02]|nr:hypothetical protein [Cyanobacteria bacterium HKST-UBA02]
MSFSKSSNNNSPIKTTLYELKDIVSRQQGEDHESVGLVLEIEAIVSAIEAKQDAISRKHKKKNADQSMGQNIVVPGMGNTVPVL